MTSRDFVYWLQGFFEISDADNGDRSEAALKGAAPLSAERVAVIKRHLAMVFIHEIDPSMGSKEHQAALTAAHGGGAAAQPPKCPLADLDLTSSSPGVDPGFYVGPPRYNC